MRQLGNALAALVIMLSSAALSERVVPAVASPEPVVEVRPVRGPVAKASVVRLQNAAALRPAASKQSKELPPRFPEQLVMLAAGVVLMGLGGRLRTPRPER